MRRHLRLGMALLSEARDGAGVDRWRRNSKGRFDLSDLISKNRGVSQKAASHIYAAGDFDGIFYQSRHGRDLDNWALFEPVRLNEASCSELCADDAAFQKALELLDLKFDPLS